MLKLCVFMALHGQYTVSNQQVTLEMTEDSRVAVYHARNLITLNNTVHIIVQTSTNPGIRNINMPWRHFGTD